MTDFTVQRLIATMEALAVTIQSLQRSYDAVLAEKSPDNRMVGAVGLGKALGLDSKTCWRRLMDGTWPSEGTGRNRRANIAVIKELRRNEVLAGGF